MQLGDNTDNGSLQHWGEVVYCNFYLKFLILQFWEEWTSMIMDVQDVYRPEGNVAGKIQFYSIENKFGYITRLDGKGDVYVTEVTYLFLDFLDLGIFSKFVQSEIKNFMTPGLLVQFDTTIDHKKKKHAISLRPLLQKQKKKHYCCVKY